MLNITDEQNESILCLFVRYLGFELHEIHDRIQRV